MNKWLMLGLGAAALYFWSRTSSASGVSVDQRSQVAGLQGQANGIQGQIASLSAMIADVTQQATAGAFETLTNTPYGAVEQRAAAYQNLFDQTVAVSNSPQIVAARAAITSLQDQYRQVQASANTLGTTPIFTGNFGGLVNLSNPAAIAGLPSYVQSYIHSNYGV